MEILEKFKYVSVGSGACKKPVDYRQIKQNYCHTSECLSE